MFDVGDRVLVGLDKTRCRVIRTSKGQLIDKFTQTYLLYDNIYQVEEMNELDEVIITYNIIKNVWYGTSVLTRDDQWYREEKLKQLLPNEKI